MAYHRIMGVLSKNITYATEWDYLDTVTEQPLDFDIYLYGEYSNEENASQALATNYPATQQLPGTLAAVEGPQEWFTYEAI